MKRLRVRPSGNGPRTPVVLAVPAVLAVAFLVLPLAGVLVRTDWGAFAGHLTAPGTVQALKLSLLVSFWALGLSLLLGVPLAWLLARVPFRGKALVRSLVLLPMVLPPTVGGVALLLAFGRRGLLGPWLESTFGITLPFHTSGAVVAATFVAMPFLVISLEGALGGLRPRYEETAASLGASPVRVFFTVTLPMVAPGLLAGAALTWARALGEFGATITFAGNLPGTTQTLPLQVYLLLQEEPEAATSVSLLLLAIAMGVLIALRGRWTGTPASPRRTAPAPEPEPSPEPQPGPGSSPEAAGAALPGGDADGGRWALRAEVGGFTELALNAEPGTTIAVVGPNGAGKTTLLRALLGLTPRAHATLRLGDADVTDLPPHRRRVAWVPQDGALFPHLSALSNTAYGLRAHGVPRAEARRAAQAWLDRLGVGQLSHRRPAQLSGGQAQRVALARALATRPRLLLLDEPLAALDQTTRAHVRHTLRSHLGGFGGVCLIVTHDPVEAVSLADRVLVLEDGRTLQDASPGEVSRHPRSPWVARMLGSNAWPGAASAEGLALDGGGALVAAEPPPPGTRALAIIAPEAVAVHREKPGGSPRNVWPGTVREITASGSRLRVLVTSDRAPDLVAEITPQAAAELGLADGVPVWTGVKATEVTVVTL
ncbi:Molybdenum transport system permease protein ModB [Streptomyces venezuelae]|uniref:ABC transporter permease n=1 Tax=Streptomyces gardneri TaxID=66892 RepID=UPI0006BDC81D|nr:ABC transporter permease [Streptomyces gardneri]ALO06754.1 Molybdenum transport system permease protein ModB [Streptomyces venezuelae]QPK44150.1 molybdate ABC transporter permease subunit [Streptomyces gardneri]WRK35427.1 ABC transporter permease [Streptomyces venezuelae]CUM42956.1 Molybdenum transport system permease protein ModB (TC 3.A.1.8.1) [Streptomyces venezuelae]